ncbi:cache domain-containing protein [Clostridium butyricum]
MKFLIKKYGTSIKINIFDKIIILLTVICFCATLTFSFISYYSSLKNNVEYIENNLEEFSENTKLLIEEYVDKNFKILEYIAGFEEIYKMDWQEQYEFLISKTKNLDFNHYIIMDILGQGHYTNTGEIKNQINEEFYRDIIFNEEFLSEPFLQVNENRSITTLSVSIYDEENEKIGALCGVIDLSKINKLFEDKTIGKEGYCFLINREGYYVSHTNMEYVHKRKNIFNDGMINEDNNIEFLKYVTNINKPLLGNVTLNNNVYYTSINPIENADWYVVYLFPKSEVMKNLNKFISSQIMVVIFGILLMLLIIRLIYTIIENHKMACTIH